MWLTTTLAAFPAILWMLLGVGLPWALIAIPRRDWRDRALVVCVTLAFGPALTTAWMFILGTLGMNDDPDAGQTLNPMQTTLIDHVGGQNLLRPELILGGMLVLAVVGWLLAWWIARRTSSNDESPDSENVRQPLAADEKVLIALIALATFARWIIQSWVSFGAWDPLWVYGYQGRIYTLAGYIPADIGYYPQFLSLQYAYLQIVVAGGIADHTARAILPFLQVGSILATYVLGSRLFNRRTGIIAAALWALYPHFGYWTRVGDLEIPVTLGFTGAAAFFLMAWTLPLHERYLRQRYALLAGLFFGIAMWTKPTAGAFVWGVLLLVMMELIRVRDLRKFLPRFEVAFITGLACIPLGALWYVRNVLIGHDALVFPPSFWLTQALRSGGEFGWPLLALGLLLAYLFFGPVRSRPGRWGVLIGVALVVAGVLPTILFPARMAALEWVLFILGVLIIAAYLVDYALSTFSGWSDATFDRLRKIGWASLLVLPYFVTWFYSYSYHYRLSFAIVPLLLLPSAVILAVWFQPVRMARWAFPRRLAYAGTVLALSAPGVGIAIYDAGLGWDWLWTKPPEDEYTVGALRGVVSTLQNHIDTTGELPVVAAPGLQPLPFFFPEMDIRIVETPLEFDQVADVDYFIDGTIARQTYDQRPDVSLWNKIYSSTRRDNIMTEIAYFQDQEFFFRVYDMHPEDRFIQPEVAFPLEDVYFGEGIQLVGYNIDTTNLIGGFNLYLVWQAVAPMTEDYTLFVHLFDADDPETILDGWDGPPMPTEFGHYTTTFWETGEYINDLRVIFPRDPELPMGDNYRLRIGFYNLETGERLPVMVAGQDNGDGYTMPMQVIKRPWEELQDEVATAD